MEEPEFELEWQNNPESDSDLKAMLEKAESEALVETLQFRREARQEIEDLRARLAVVAHLRHPPVEVKKNCCNEITLLAQHLGDVLASYGCQIGTDVAYSLKDLIELAPETNNCLARAVEVHLQMLDSILKEGICGDGGKAGLEIRQGLQRVSNLATIVEIPMEIDVIAV